VLANHTARVGGPLGKLNTTCTLFKLGSISNCAGEHQDTSLSLENKLQRFIAISQLLYYTIYNVTF